VSESVVIREGDWCEEHGRYWCEACQDEADFEEASNYYGE
jgi:hypothetical protein